MADETGTDGAKTTAPEPTDDVAVTNHELGRGRSAISYTATTGRIVLREESIADGVFEGTKARAQIFHVAYVKDDQDPATRPVTFCFNGGPGSSSVWLHLGLFGPRRVLMGDAGDLARPPYGIDDNLESLLSVSDLVFIDPVTTGYSRTADGHQAGDFHGFRRDLESVGEFIRLWTSRNDRWLSPKFLAGESYGTTRAAGLADLLATEYGFYVNGLMLISSVLDFGTIHYSEGNDLPFSTFLPTFAATALYHGVTTGTPSASSSQQLRDRVAEAEAFAATDLPWALARGHRLGADDRARIVARYAELTGLDPDFVERADLRVTLFAFTAELLRSRGELTGRLDMRFTGWPDDKNGARMDHDPSHAAILGPYAAAFNGYVRADLGYASDLPYNILTGKVHPWSYKEFEGENVEVATSLANAMRHNPHLKVQIACGYFDGATPHFGAEHVAAHLRLPAAELDRIEWCYYEAGHMTYVHEPSRIQQSADLIRFVTEAS